MTALAIGTLGSGVVTQRSAHSSFIDGIVLAGLNPGFVYPNVDRSTVSPMASPPTHCARPSSHPNR